MIKNKISNDGGALAKTYDEYEKCCFEALRYIHDADLMDRSMACRYCGSKRHMPLPMLKDEVWFKAVPDGHGCLCAACFEKRVGRPIALEDLADLDGWEKDIFYSFLEGLARHTGISKPMAEKILKKFRIGESRYERRRIPSAISAGE